MKSRHDIDLQRGSLEFPKVSESNHTDTGEPSLPIDMTFNDGHVLSIVVYSVLMVFSAIGNITVLVLLIRRRRKSSSRINSMLMHLAIADLLVSVYHFLLLFPHK